jgi:hypothetical protein
MLHSIALALCVAACVDTTLDMPSNHPANPAAYPAAPAQPPAALASGFDPFAAYGNEQEPPSAASGHEHSQGAEPAPTGTTSTSAAPAEAPAADTVVYTCPMHPEIVRNAPGKCPICGMTLVPKKPSK